MTSRRAFLLGLGAALAAPAIIRTPGLLMPVRKLVTSGVNQAFTIWPTRVGFRTILAEPSLYEVMASRYEAAIKAMADQAVSEIMTRGSGNGAGLIDRVHAV